MRELSYLKLIFHLFNVLGRECVSHFSHVATTDSKSNREGLNWKQNLTSRITSSPASRRQRNLEGMYRVGNSSFIIFSFTFFYNKRFLFKPKFFFYYFKVLFS